MRADLALVQRGLFESRARAREAIEAGLVTAAGRAVRKPSEPIAPDAAIAATPPHPYVSRSALKLAAALDAFGIDPAGRDCLDLGASTGGFTEVLLGRGAARVHAVDVGHGQLHARLASDGRVVSLEGTDARTLGELLGDRQFALVTMDLSFISARLVLPTLQPLFAPGCALLILVKPQFEVGRAGIGRGGIVRDEGARQRAMDGVADCAVGLGFALLGTMPSPLPGRDGNLEWLLAARWPSE